MADSFERFVLFETFMMLVAYTTLLEMTDAQLAFVGVPEAGRTWLARAREHLESQAALERMAEVPRGVVHTISDAFSFDTKLLSAFERGGEQALIAELLKQADRHPD